MSADEIRSLVAATRAVAKAERERDEARAALIAAEAVLDKVGEALDNAHTDLTKGHAGALRRGFYAVAHIMSEEGR